MSNNTRLKILVVDDDRTLRALLRLALEEDGYEVFEAKDGEQCLTDYQLHQPDMVLLDGVMPELDGFGCCQRLRNFADGDLLPILMITVLDDQESVDQAFAAGATDYITKPIHWAVLSQRVRRLLKASSILKEAETIKHLLHQQQEWEELWRSLLNVNNSQGDYKKTIQDFFKLDNLFIYQPQTSLQPLPINAAVWQPIIEYIKSQNLAVVTQSQLTPPLVAVLTKLKIHSVILAPIVKGLECQGFLIGYSQHNREWNPLEVQRFADLSKFMYYISKL